MDDNSVVHMLLEWALTGQDAFSNGDALALLQIVILLYAFRDRIFRHVSLQELEKDVNVLRNEVSAVSNNTQYIRGAIATVLRTQDGDGRRGEALSG